MRPFLQPQIVRFHFSHFVVLAILTSMTWGCAGKRAREARLKEREEISRQSQLYCQFVSGEEFPDIDVKTNIEMGKKCEKEKPFSISHYVTPSKISGMMFCCHSKAQQAIKPEEATPSASRFQRSPAPRSPASNPDARTSVNQSPSSGSSVAPLSSKKPERSRTIPATKTRP